MVRIAGLGAVVCDVNRKNLGIPEMGKEESGDGNSLWQG